MIYIMSSNNLFNKFKYSELLELIDNIEKKKEWDLSVVKNKYLYENRNKKQNIIECFKFLINKLNAYEEPGNIYKIRELNEVIRILSEYDSDINDLEEITILLTNNGKKKPEKTLLKIKEILETGTLRSVEKLKNDSKINAVNNLTKIYGVGTKKAIELYSKYNIITVLDLKNYILMYPEVLNEKQKIGLTYYDDLNERIPRYEMISYDKFLQKIINNLNIDINFSINGSYRRNQETSGDIDVLISSENPIARKIFIDELKKQKIIREVLADGSKKFMGISKLTDSKKFRHIDIIECKPSEYPFAQLYFTGSGGFNSKMRGIALEKGYSMNEYCISNKLTKEPVNEELIQAKLGKKKFENEIDIFKFLDMEYVSPEKRLNITDSKIKYI